MMDDVDFVLSAEDRSELLACVTLLREAGQDDVADRLEVVVNNLVEL